MATFNQDRYAQMPYRRCGNSGLKLPAVSLGGWHNFTEESSVRSFLRAAFDAGVTHFDLANNYGPPPGRAEEMVGRVLKSDFASHRDELIITTKAGYGMWPGPYGDHGSRKYLLASLDQSLKRLGVEYVDIFYHHRPDPETPLEETMGALDTAVRSGKTLYAGVSNYSGEQTVAAANTLRQLGTPLTVHQPSYNMLQRAVETDLMPAVEACGVGVVAFCPLAQGLLTDRYLLGIPKDSRAADPTGFLSQDAITPRLVATLKQLAVIAAEREQTLAQLALTWVLRLSGITSVITGMSRVSQLEQNLQAATAAPISVQHLQQIESLLAQAR